jgi:alkylation response protein AidB-like acyl-CoA dehydrogenase
MEFNLSENTTMVADTARRYLKDHYGFVTYNEQLNQTSHCDPARWGLMMELGWLGLPFPETVGGYGGELIDVAMIVRELGAALCLDPYVDLVVAPGKLLEYIGSERAIGLLQSIVEDNEKVACAFYECRAGYNIHKPTSSIRGGKLSGQKSFVPDGGCASKILVTARLGEELVLLVVPLESCKITRYRALDGSRFVDLVFHDIVIEDGMILLRGAETSRVISQVVAWLQALDCARMYGAANALYQRTLEYAKTRKQFGAAIGNFQVIQHYLVDMFTDLQQLESMLFMVAVKAELGNAQERDRACSAAKAYYADKAVKIAQQAIQIHGGIGVTEELDIGHYFRLMTHCSLTHGHRDYHLDRLASLSEVNGLG